MEKSSWNGLNLEPVFSQLSAHQKRKAVCTFSSQSHPVLHPHCVSSPENCTVYYFATSFISLAKYTPRKFHRSTPFSQYNWTQRKYILPISSLRCSILYRLEIHLYRFQSHPSVHLYHHGTTSNRRWFILLILLVDCWFIQTLPSLHWILAITFNSMMLTNDYIWFWVLTGGK